jgi:hypothetical protein
MTFLSNLPMDKSVDSPEYKAPAKTTTHRFPMSENTVQTDITFPLCG